MLKNYRDEYVSHATEICDRMLPSVSKLAMYFKIPSEVHFHVDLPRENSVGFILDPMRVYIEQEGFIGRSAINFDVGDIMLLDTRTLHAARALLKKPWTFFVGVTFFCRYSEVLDAFNAWALMNKHPLMRSVRPSPSEDVASLYIPNQEVVLP